MYNALKPKDYCDSLEKQGVNGVMMRVDLKNVNRQIAKKNKNMYQLKPSQGIDARLRMKALLTGSNFSTLSSYKSGNANDKKQSVT